MRSPYLPERFESFTLAERKSAMLERIKNALLNSYRDDKVRQLLIFQILNLLLFAVAATMSVLNIITKEYVLFWVTAVYSVLCFVNLLLSKKSHIAWPCFFVETLILMSTFIITGTPGGFSILWILVIPAAATSVFGIKAGGIYSAVFFFDVVFFFWTPFGRNLLMYDYSEIYMLRFPFVYICMYLIALYVEWIRHKTLESLIASERQNRWLYRHDALTGAYNRHAFHEELSHLLSDASGRVVATIMVDIDNFKRINDTYGHNVGDRVLCCLSDIILKNICEHCLSCRWGGEEFLIAMGCEHDPMQIAEMIRQEVEQNRMKLETSEILTFTVSAGISLGEFISLDGFIEQIDLADKAMYKAKFGGKNRVVLGTQEHGAVTEGN